MESLACALPDTWSHLPRASEPLVDIDRSFPDNFPQQVTSATQPSNMEEEQVVQLQAALPQRSNAGPRHPYHLRSNVPHQSRGDTSGGGAAADPSPRGSCRL